MGMFDYITYRDKEYQTKDTPEQFMEHYAIRGDELWYKKVEREWIEDKISMIGGGLEEISFEWVFCNKFDGVICFYRPIENDTQREWEEYKALFMNGKLIKMEIVE
jgi:hypothetical protein